MKKDETISRNYSTSNKYSPNNELRKVERSKRNRTLAMYSVAAVISFVGVSYAAVPLYQMFCQLTGYGGTVREGGE